MDGKWNLFFLSLLVYSLEGRNQHKVRLLKLDFTRRRRNKNGNYFIFWAGITILFLYRGSQGKPLYFNLLWQIEMCKKHLQSNLAIRNGLIRNKLVLRNHFLWPICHLLHKDKELFALRNNFRATKKFLIAKFDCTWF